ncbi:MAG: Ig-like domain-containing protein [Armatimonadota bacterium]|nr:Ig-like domain-containing protein [Armatimonadota bacterium]MDR7450568.1 Ig-like domain-containing protein [Armatimonadota bacterium]MDR7466299.1 Ig-like domain-containing protein [Armatimonadota bacterium]MDR7493020.1 Ig-like domain-containing protein [Armatimonadota bacterium]MDR7498223.1 Ig-like domain-containing protein [Armatimonadota bacterium]
MRLFRSLAVLGLLLVAGGASAADGAEPARISLLKEVRADGSTRVVATVQDDAGAPAGGTAVTFLARTAFGWLELAEVEADAAGTASVTLNDPPRYTEVRAVAGESATLQAGLQLLSPRVRDPQRRPGLDVLRGMSPQPGFISPYPPVQILVVAVLLGGIWTTYAYLVALLMGIRRAS